MEKKESYTIEIDEEIKPDEQAESGVPWEKMKFTVNAKSFAGLMRDNNIRTLKDVRTDPQTVIRLLQRTYNVDLGAVLMFAQKYEEG